MPDPLPHTTGPISGGILYPFKWFFRPKATETVVPVVQIKEDLHEFPFDQLPSVLSEIDSRHWSAIRQILIEAKLKAELQLRNDEVIKNTQLVTYYQGWVNYADYILGNLEGLRAGIISYSGSLAQDISQNVRG